MRTLSKTKKVGTLSLLFVPPAEDGGKEISMNEEFVKSVYATIVEEGEKIYKELYENTKITEQTSDYWKNAIELYKSFNVQQKDVFFQIIRQIMIDTISGIFGAFDGSSTLINGDFECEVRINGVFSENELQDNFLGFVEMNDN